MRRIVCLSLLVAGGALASALGAPAAAAPISNSTRWLMALNARRAEAGVPLVAEKPTFSVGGALHARYLVKTGIMGLGGAHTEDPNSPWYTAEGDAAGRNSNVVEASLFDVTDQFAIDSWILAPFHAVSMLAPTLREVGFGSYRERGGPIQWAAVLDTGRGHDVTRAFQYPLIWPRDGVTIAPPHGQLCPPGTACHSQEDPSPLAGCLGYSSPAGIPIIMEFGPGSGPLRVTSSSLTTSGAPLEHCLVDATYTNPDRAQQDLVRLLLQRTGALVFMPKRPLRLGQTYTMSVAVDGSTRAWTFSIGVLDGIR